MIEQQIKQTLKSLKFYFYGFYILALLATTLGIKILEWGIKIDSTSEMGVSLSSLAIILVLTTVPLSLSFFNKYIKKLRLVEIELEFKLEKYKKASIYRILVMGLGLIAGIVLFYILQTNSMLLIAGISAIGLIFCKPAEVKIISDLQIGDEDNYDDKDKVADEEDGENVEVEVGDNIEQNGSIDTKKIK